MGARVRHLIVAIVGLVLLAAAAQDMSGVLDNSHAVQILEARTMHPICSGGIIRGYVVSAGHCVSDNPTGVYLARTTDGRLWPLRLVDYALAWPGADYALFRSPLAYLRRGYAIGSLEALRPGDAIYYWGSPLRIQTTYFAGYYSGRIHDPDVPRIAGMALVIIAGDFGSSGSILLDSGGRAVGILVGGFSAEVKLHGVLAVPLPPL